jgi:hypothetical protein
MADDFPGRARPLSAAYRPARASSAARPAGVAKSACSSFSRYRRVFTSDIGLPSTYEFRADG